MNAREGKPAAFEKSCLGMDISSENLNVFTIETAYPLHPMIFNSESDHFVNLHPVYSAEYAFFGSTQESFV